MEARLAQIEARLGLNGTAEHAGESPAAIDAAVPLPAGPTDITLDEQVGQNGFAVAGIVTLTVGVGFILSLPHPGLPAAVPSLLGLGLAVGVWFAAQWGQRAFGSLADFIRGAAMALLFLAALRLYFFGRPPALALETPLGRALLVLAVVSASSGAWRRQSPWLVLLAFGMAAVATLLINSGWFILFALPLLGAVVVALARWRSWPALTLAAIPLLTGTYFIWAIGNPLVGGKFHYAAEPLAAPGALLVTLALLAASTLVRAPREAGNGALHAAAALTCAFGYGAFLVHTAAAFPVSFAALHAGAFVVFLGLAVVFWRKTHLQVPTFFYAMTAYAALSMAIIKVAPMPERFVWLSLQSVIVVSTAIAFRSRLIVVANFLIYAAIVLGYMVVVGRETGISVGFGVVALVSARILNWQQHRLELKTELMRNAYLLSAFIVFPYALYHLVPTRFVALAWVGLAVGYYALNVIVRNQKYRWMAHATLVLAAVFLVLIGTRQLDPVYRIASFLALGTVLLVVSRTFARVRR